MVDGEFQQMPGDFAIVMGPLPCRQQAIVQNGRKSVMLRFKGNESQPVDDGGAIRLANGDLQGAQRRHLQALAPAWRCASIRRQLRSRKDVNGIRAALQCGCEAGVKLGIQRRVRIHVSRNESGSLTVAFVQAFLQQATQDLRQQIGGQGKSRFEKVLDVIRRKSCTAADVTGEFKELRQLVQTGGQVATGRKWPQTINGRQQTVQVRGPPLRQQGKVVATWPGRQGQLVADAPAPCMQHGIAKQDGRRAFADVIHVAGETQQVPGIRRKQRHQALNQGESLARAAFLSVQQQATFIQRCSQHLQQGGQIAIVLL